MTILNFSIEYIVRGESRVILELYSADGAGWGCVPMVSSDRRMWRCAVGLDCSGSGSVRFRFRLECDGKTADSEQRGFFHLSTIPQTGDVTLYCRWNTDGITPWLYSSAFKDCLFAHSVDEVREPVGNGRWLFLNVPEYVPPIGKRLLLVGSSSALGRWNPSDGVPVKRTGCYSWQARVDADSVTFPMEYKFVLQDEKTLDVVWEAGANRCLFSSDKTGHAVVEESPLRLPSNAGRVGGVVIPVFSLRSRTSCGVGDFGDLRRMTDWAASVGLHVVQVLPVNDTTRSGTWTDSYPYNGISVFALHPMYIDLCALKPLKDKLLAENFHQTFGRLNSLAAVDYEEVNREKDAYFRVYYRQEGEQTEKSPEYAAFINAEKKWLQPYCYFRFLQRHFGTSDFRCWPHFNCYDRVEIERWIENEGYGEEVRYYAFVQYLLYRQLSEVHAHARRCGVVLKGDIPIGVSRDSATAWSNPRLFNFDGQAGAPPDYFSADGQNWGFPTYNWQEILKDGGQWWQERLRYMAHFFDAYRIDHVLGFFRIWEIPRSYVSGMVGHFNPALPLDEEEIRKLGFKAAIDAPQESGDGNIPEEELKERLFFADSHERGKYHPNIGAKGTRAYAKLSESDRDAYNRLADDFFFHRHDALWTEGAVRKLLLLTHATDMLPCAEDLGMIPDCMRTVLNFIHILSLEVESMPKYSRGRFADVMQNPLLSVDTITTHDMQPLRLWWQKNREAVCEYYNQVLRHEGNAPQEMSGSLCAEVLLRHLASPSLLCVIALQDWLAMDERLRSDDVEGEQINKPAVARHYWRYRMNINIEELEADASFCSALKTLLARTGRA